MINDVIDKFIIPVVAAIVSAFVLLIRKVLVNEEAIKLLQQEAKAREDRRLEEREILRELKAELKEVRQGLQEMYRLNNPYNHK